MKRNFDSPSDKNMNSRDVNWRIDNIVPLLLVLGSFFVYLIRLSIVETKLDNIITNQTELSQEFKDWRKQSETRLGIAEGNIRVLSSFTGATIR